MAPTEQRSAPELGEDNWNHDVKHHRHQQCGPRNVILLDARTWSVRLAEAVVDGAFQRRCSEDGPCRVQLPDPAVGPLSVVTKYTKPERTLVSTIQAIWYQ